MYQDDDSIVCTGFLTPPDVHQLLSHAGIFALPSSHEGLPIALLEAMKMGIPVLASNIAGNASTVIGVTDSVSDTFIKPRSPSVVP